jgi:predicted ArsR family transcriptional regulator
VKYGGAVAIAERLSASKRRIVDALKRRPRTSPELAEQFGLSTEAIRQHLAGLSEHGLVRSSRRPTTGAGRPPVEWSLTDMALDLFPDRHADLTVSLIESIRAAVGEEGLQAVIDQRTGDQLRSYRCQLGDSEDTDDREDREDRVEALARLRTDDGYMAEITESPDSDGRLLIEHHCPICDAAAVCQGLCQGELELFRSVLGPSLDVTREQHLLAGDERCVYRISPRRRAVG